ncbi:MAG TPA: hypothetical protein VNN80_25650, partial [Polyangiaceae bacterium]|nr:hypothetical protein [Polyangiaceae bacterium]
VVLDALHQELHGHDEPRGQAEFALNALSLGLCPLRIGSPTLELRPCASGAFGWLDVEGSQTYVPRGQTRPWSSVGAGLSLSAALGIVELRASFAAALPSRRDSFRFSDDVFYHVAPVIWSGAVGAGLTLR